MPYWPFDGKAVAFGTLEWMGMLHSPLVTVTNLGFSRVSMVSVRVRVRF